MKIGQIVKWENIPMGHYGGVRNGRRVYILAKQDWVINPDHNGVMVNVSQGITRSIDPDQYVLYLGAAGDVAERARMIDTATWYAYPPESDSGECLTAYEKESRKNWD
jgi:hypothetical protein